MASLLRERVCGLAWAAGAVIIWSGSLVMLRLGVTTSLNGYDLAALRFAVAALVLLPVIHHRGWAYQRLGLGGILGLMAGFGAPYVLLISLGLESMPASAAGAINPGVMAVASVSLGWKMCGDTIGSVRIIGNVVILGGATLLALTPGRETTPFGYLCLVGTGVMWAGYALVVRRAGIGALHATAIVAVGSAVLYLPLYLGFLPKHLPSAPASDILIQAVFQGVFVSAVAVFAFNRSSELLGPVAGAKLPALIPLATLGLGALVLNEGASLRELAAVVSIGMGVVLSLVGGRWNLVRRLARRVV